MLSSFVMETANAPGTGTLNLLGAVSGRRAFYPAFPSGSVVFYVIADGTLWEEGWGVLTSGAPCTLTRNPYSNSSGGTTLVNFPGLVDVYCNVPSTRAMFYDKDDSHKIVGMVQKNYGAFAPTDNFPGAPSDAAIVAVLGSSGTPNATNNPIAVFQKFGGSTSPETNPTAYFSAHKTRNGGSFRAVSIFAETIDVAGWNGSGANNFAEGARFQCVTRGPLGSPYGVISFAGESGAGATHLFAVAHEGEVWISSADAPDTFDNSSFTAAHLATSGGGKRKDGAFIVNPYTTTANQFVRGFFVPNGYSGNSPVKIAAFQTEATCLWGLLVSGPTYGAVGIPNSMAMRARSAGGGSYLNFLYVDSSDRLVLGQETPNGVVVMTRTTSGVPLGMREIIVGAADSGGTGYRSVIVGN